MQQCMQSGSDVQSQLAVFLSARQDAVVMMPASTAWYDFLPDVFSSATNSFTVVLYADHFRLAQDYRLLKRRGAADGIRAITSQLPPHAIRHIWEEVGEQRCSVLMATLSYFVSPGHSERFISSSHSGLIVLAQGQEFVSPGRHSYFQAFVGLLRDWPDRPPMVLFCSPLPPDQLAALQSLFEISVDPLLHVSLPLVSLQFRVAHCFTQQQKKTTLLKFIAAPGTERMSVVICPSIKEIQLLASKLSLPTVSYHSDLSERDLELMFSSVNSSSETIVLVTEEAFTLLLPSLVRYAELRIAFWQLPVSLEALFRTILVSAAPGVVVHSVLLYTKEDYLFQRQLLKRDPDVKRLVALTQVRAFCLANHACRRSQISSMLLKNETEPEPCGFCDVCINQKHSSRWMNLLRRVLY